jgi:hypothetical protein
MYNKDKIYQVLNEIQEDSKNIKPYIVIAQPRRTLEEIPAQKLQGDQLMHVDFSCFSRGYCSIEKEKVDVARNYLIEQTIASGTKYLFFIGEDTVIPYDGFLQLHETAEANPDAMIVGVYYIKLSIPMIMIKQDDFVIPANVDPGKIIEVWLAGLDAALIPIKLLKEMHDNDPDLPFCCIAGIGQGMKSFIGEDNFFYHRWHKAGYRVLCNTNIQCLHCDLELHKYTAHPSITPEIVKQKYFTNFPLEGELTMADKEIIDRRWMEKLPK